MSEKIRDGYSGGTYTTGKVFEMFAPTVDRLGVTGKFNLLVDEVGQITSLTTTNKTSVISAVNEVKSGADASVKLNSTPQTLVGTYNFGATTGTANKVLFKHDVEFQGSVQFNSGAGDTLDIDNTFIALGDSVSPTPVGDGGLILQRGVGLQDARIFWDESDAEWKLKSGVALSYGIVHKGNTSANALNYILTGDLNAVDFESISNTPALRLIKSSASTNAKTWSFNNSTTNDDLQISGLSDNLSSTYQAYRINRTTSTITGHQFFTNEVERLKIDNTNVTSSIPLKVNSIVENTLNNGVLVDSLIVKDEGILNGSVRLANFLNSGTLFNPGSVDLDLTVNGNGSQALFLDAGTSQFFSRYNTYLDQSLFVNTITQRGSSGVTVSSLLNCPANLNITNTTPTITLNESDQAVDTKIWNIRSVGGLFKISSIDDAGNVGTAYEITRTAGSPTFHRHYIGLNSVFLLQQGRGDIGSVTLDQSTQFNIKCKLGFNSNLYFRQEEFIRGGLEYIHSTNSFNLTRYAVTSGVYLGGITLTESAISIKTLPLIVESTLSTNTINPFSGSLTTVNQNLNITGVLCTNSDKLVFGTNADQVDRIEFNEATNEFIFFEDNSVNNSTISSGKSKLTNTTAPVNTKSTISSINSLGELLITSVSDDGVSTSNIFKNIKSGINTTSQLFYINNVTELSLTQNNLIYGSGLNDLDINYNLNAKNGFNANISIQQGSSTKGRLTYIDSSNIFGLYRYADVGGSYVGGLQLSETNILVDNLSLDVETNLKVDSILEFTNNNGIDIDGVLIRDGFINLGSSNAIQSIGDVNVVIDSDNNGTNNFNIYSNSIGSTNHIFRITELGATTINSVLGGDILSIVDANASSAVLANPIISFDYSNGVGATITRAGYVGFGATTNDNLYLVNDTGSIFFSSTNIDLNDTDLTLDTSITTSNKNINIGSGNLTMGLSGLYYDSGDIVLKQDTSDGDTLRLQSVGSMIFNIDDNNNNTGKDYQWRHNGVGYGGSALMVLNDSATLSLYGNLVTQNNDIHVGTGNISFTTYNSDYINFNDTTNEFNFVADGTTTTSKIVVGAINLGNEDFSDYDEGTWSPDFYNGNTQITGSSSNTDVNSAVAYYTRYGNMVTVTLSNIHWAITGSYAGTVKGEYPAISTGVYTIRNLPFAAFDESAGSLFGSAIGGGNRSPNAYIGDDENFIRFSDFEYQAAFGLRSVTITYRVA